MINMKTIIAEINKLGYNTYTFDYSIYNNYIATMLGWYKGRLSGVHDEDVYNGHKNVHVNYASLHMAKRVCEDHASLTFNENVKINIKDKDASEYIIGYDELNGVLADNDFWKVGSELYEVTCALGTGAFEIVVDGLKQYNEQLVGGKDVNIKILVHNALEILPLSWDNNKNIKEVAFVDQYKIKNDNYIDLRLHVLVDGTYKIVNKTYKVVLDSALTPVKNKNILEVFDTHSDVPWFACLKLPIINNYDIQAVMGASIYANATDVLKTIDSAFDMLCFEIKSGRKKVFINKNLLNRNPETNEPVFPDDVGGKLVFYYVGSDNNTNITDGKDLVSEFNPDLRIDDITKCLENNLNYLSNLCGLGNNYYKFVDGTVQKTATEVISENSGMYRGIRKNELALEKVLITLVRGILYASNLCRGTKFNIDTDISVEFDASIIEDKTAIRARELEEVKAGILPVSYYQQKYYGDLGIKNDDTTKNNDGT